MDQHWKELADKLPKQPCDDLKQSVLMDIYDSGDCLGQGLLLFHREAVTLMDEIQELMEPEDWARLEKSKKHRWGARCTCTNCGEDFIAGYSQGGIVLADGPDGQTYSGYAEPGPDSSVYFDGETVLCPLCWADLEVTHRSHLRSGRTLQCLQAEVINADGYRRPERSYYTLQINMTGTIPREIQLHGYGNERHGDHKQFKHTIPKKVRDFCDRWERDVLLPWFVDQKAQAAGKKLHKLRRMA